MFMRENRERRLIERTIHGRLHGPAKRGAAVPRYCEDETALAQALSLAAAVLRVPKLTPEPVGQPAPGEWRYVTLRAGPQETVGAGPTHVEASAHALGALLGAAVPRPEDPLPAAVRLGKQHGLTLERCEQCRHGVRINRDDASSPTGRLPVVPCEFCNGRARVWWSADHRFVPGFSDEEMIHRVAPADWRKLVDEGEIDADGFAP